MSYRRRIVDDLLDELMPELAAIALEGAKGVGKTATATQRVSTVLSLSQPGQRAIVAADPTVVVRLDPPVFIDEWQLEPTVWDQVRASVDDDRTGGRFLLAGSAGVAPGARIHSGAGRIVSLAMRPLSIAERGVSEVSTSLGGLLSSSITTPWGRTEVGLEAYVDEILRSGFPGLRDLSERARRRQLASYVSRVVDRELPENGVEVRRPGALTSWLTAYAAATASTTSYSNLLDAATAGVDDKPARSTVDSYREHLQRLFILDPVPAWSPVFNPLKRLTAAPKHHLVDPAIAAELVGVGKHGLLSGDGRLPARATGTWLGALFESLVAQSVRVYAEANDATVGHLRTKDGVREVDLIVEGQDRRIVAIEVKLSSTVDDKDVRHLNWLHDQLGDRLADRVVISTGEFAYRRPDGVAVIPLALLGP